MLRIIQNSHAGGAKKYFSTADYYTEGQELTGVWHGKGAEQLGLAGNVQQRQWDVLCDGIHPNSGERLMQRLKSNRTIGYDFNFHVPKSVSLLYAATRDERLLDAFREAVGATMQDIEAEASTRVRKSGEKQDRITGNLTWGEFIHFTARPVDGVPDPHLHAHCFVFNTTWDGKENAWKAGQFRNLKRDAPYFEAMYHSRLADNLRQLGLPIERTAKGWELSHLPSELLKKFSRRKEEIERRAEALGIDDPDAKAELGAKTRSRKVKHLTFPELQREWRSRMTGSELASLAALADRIGDAAPRDFGAAQYAVDYAVAHDFERASVVPERTLLATALKRAAGFARPDEVVKCLREADLIRGERDGRTMVTTAEVLDEEREIVAFARDGRGQCKPLGPSGYTIERDWLNASQRSAVRHILQSRDRVIAVRGVAGVGKTSLMQETVEAVESLGTKVIAVAPSAAASRGVLRGDGFHEADTVARLLLDESLQESARDQLIWVDEAGLLGTRTLRDLFRLADLLDARILLVGDKFQHGSVQRGAALRLLEEEAGIVPATVKEIQRQSGEYKAAVKSLSEGRVCDGFRTLDRLGWIREIPDDERYKVLAADYAETIQQGKTALVVSPTHFEGRNCSGEIRRLLREQGIVHGEEREFATLVNAQLTEAEKTDPANYRAGVVQFHQNAKGFIKGHRLNVGNDVLPFDQSHRFTVFHRSQLRLARGDVVRVTHKGLTADGKHRLDNGTTFTVKEFDRDGNVVLTNGWTIGRDFGHLTHGYVVTSHASQGRTVDRVFIGQGSDSLRAASREQFYVSVSRGKQQATIYTDDKAALLEAVQQSDDRATATEFVGRERQRQRMRRFEQLTAEREAPIKGRQVELVHER
jgi:conjugative relaxase-like TrwC/TraI family protein